MLLKNWPQCALWQNFEVLVTTGTRSMILIECDESPTYSVDRFWGVNYLSKLMPKSWQKFLVTCILGLWLSLNHGKKFSKFWQLTEWLCSCIFDRGSQFFHFLFCWQNRTNIVTKINTKINTQGVFLWDGWSTRSKLWLYPSRTRLGTGRQSKLVTHRTQLESTIVSP